MSFILAFQNTGPHANSADIWKLRCAKYILNLEVTYGIVHSEVSGYDKDYLRWQAA